MLSVHTMVLVAHVLIGAMIIGLVLLQRGKGAETGAAFGSGASGTVFGAKGSANFLSRSTAVLATLFFATSLSLAYLGSQRQVVKSVLEQTDADVVTPAPALAPAPEGAGQPADGTAPVLPVLPAVPAKTDTGSPAAGNGSSSPAEPGSPAR